MYLHAVCIWHVCVSECIRVCVCVCVCVCVVCVFVLCVVHTVCRCERHEDVWGRLSMRGVVRKNVCGVCGVCGVCV